MRRLAAAITAAVLLSGCGPGLRALKGGSGSLSLGVDISRVKAFVYQQGSGLNHVHAVLTNGETQEINFGASEGNGSGASPEAFGLAGSRSFVFFVFVGITMDGSHCDLIAVSKRDGSTTCIDANLSQDGNPLTGILVSPQPYVQSDETGTNIWVGINALFSTTFGSTPPNRKDAGLGQVIFAENQDGDILVYSSSQTPTVRSASGTTTSAGASTISCPTAGARSFGPTDFFYVAGSAGGVLHRMTKSSGGDTFSDAVGATVPAAITCETGIARTTQNVFLGGSAAQNTFYDVASSTARTATGLTTLNRIAAGGDVVALLGKNGSGGSGIVRFNTVGSTTQTVVAPGTYSISAIDVSESSEITFFGTQISGSGPDIQLLGAIKSDGTTVTTLTNALSDIKTIVRVD